MPTTYTIVEIQTVTREVRYQVEADTAERALLSHEQNPSVPISESDWGNNEARAYRIEYGEQCVYVLEAEGFPYGTYLSKPERNRSK